MSTIDRIREAMAAFTGPVRPKDIAEHLELDGKAVGQAMYQAAAQGAGIERDDDGSYSLIPGWTKGRAAESEAAPAPPSEKRAPVKTPAKAARKKAAPKAARSKRVVKPRIPRAAKKSKPQPKASRVARPAVAERPSGDVIPMQRAHVRLLVCAVLAFGDELADPLRAAVLEATRLAA